MKNKIYDCIIIGAGPAGLTFARMLKDRGEDSFLVLEKESEAGGLCRSTMVDGSPFDIGGGHFLDVRRPKVNELLFRFLPEDLFPPVSKMPPFYQRRREMAKYPVLQLHVCNQ